jgi:hypothetical protein
MALNRVRGCPGCGVFGCWIAKRGHARYGNGVIGWLAAWAAMATGDSWAARRYRTWLGRRP